MRVRFTLDEFSTKYAINILLCFDYVACVKTANGTPFVRLMTRRRHRDVLV